MENFKISIIVPVYNSSFSLSACIKSISSQTFSKPFEIIFIDDGSTDDSLDVIKKNKLINGHCYKLNKNSGPATARNYGLSKSRGEYIFFLDADDEIEPNTLSYLYEKAIEGDYDLVFSDKKRIEKKINQKKNNYFFKNNQVFNREDILSELKKRFYDPLYIGGIVGITGRLIRRSVVINNSLKFVEKLRFLEDDTFSYDLLSSVKKAFYLKEQLYIYNINPNLETGISKGISHNLSITNYKIVKDHLFNALKNLGLKNDEVKTISDQAFIYIIIKALISFSRSIILKKIDFKKGQEIKKIFIYNIVSDQEVLKTIKNYKISNNESFLIPKAIKWRSQFLLKIASELRAKKILKIRRNIN